MIKDLSRNLRHHQNSLSEIHDASCSATQDKGHVGYDRRHRSSHRDYCNARLQTSEREQPQAGIFEYSDSTKKKAISAMRTYRTIL